MRLAVLFLVLAGCDSSTNEEPPMDAGRDALITDAGGDVTVADGGTGPADSEPTPLDQGGYPCGAVTTYPFDGGSQDSGSLDSGDDGGLSYAQCRSLCAGAPGGVRACYLGDGGTTLVCQAPECG